MLNGLLTLIEKLKRKVDNPTIKVTEYEVPEADTDVEEIKTGE